MFQRLCSLVPACKPVHAHIPIAPALPSATPWRTARHNMCTAHPPHASQGSEAARSAWPRPSALSTRGRCCKRCAHPSCSLAWAPRLRALHQTLALTTRMHARTHTHTHTRKCLCKQLIQHTHTRTYTHTRTLQEMLPHVGIGEYTETRKAFFVGYMVHRWAGWCCARAQR